MYKISFQHLDRFKRGRKDYFYQVSKGVFITFNNINLNYNGIMLTFLPKSDYYEKIVDKALNDLFIQGILEYID